jgi:GNAT superfamily N-acetyltransferase
VQLFVRVQRPPIGDGILLLGEDEGGRLCAVVVLYDAARDRESCVMKLAAVAVSWHRQGQGLGAEALEMALRAAEDRAYGTGCLEVTVIGWVHVRNPASRALCTAAGFACDGPTAENPSYEEWGMTLELPPETPLH